ncbi:TonB-dependent receptor [Kordiimonas aquimaris]|uniref:TonB-dependent receptor n=1 Tax=Kordiimonas aquimaris TaxID=707591 RepID=UPI0021D14CFC|nr:TonB-dependent receptor [Kordiimonas aquimaris]
MNSQFHVINKKTIVRLLSTTAITLASAQAYGQSDNLAVEEILVTATKRTEAITEVPLAILAFSGDFTRDRNLDDVKDLITYSPGITGNSKDSFIDAVAIRGIRTQDFGVGGDPSVGFFKNGFYQGRNGAVVSSLFDIERAEVLRGPQNFLFGRNAISGAISTHTARPKFDSTSGFIDLDVGERGHFVGEGAINLPVNENFALRFAGYYSTEDGYVDNAFDPNGDRLIAHDKWAVRGSADYQNGPLSIQLTAEYEDREQSGSVYRATGLGDNFDALEELFGPFNLPEDGRDVNQDNSFGSIDEGEVGSVTLRVDYDLDFAVLTSQTGYKEHTYNYREDFDGLPISINNFGLDQKGTYFEQELRLVSQNDGPLSWYVGASYYNEDLDALFSAQGDEEVICAYYYFAYYGENLNGSCLADVYYATAVPEGLLEQGDVDGKYTGYAAYVDLTYQFTDTFDFSIGLRYTDDKKTFSNNVLPVTSALGPFFTYSITTNGPLTDTRSYDALTPRFVARWRPDDDNTYYASVTRGFKAGGFGTFGFSPVPGGPAISAGDELQPGDAVPDDFDPEKLWSFEAGHKGRFLDGRISTDLNLYYYDYKDLQLLVFQDGGGLIFNLGNVKGYGAEGTITGNLNQYFDAFASLAFNETDITDAGPACSLPTCDGNTLGTPRWSGAVVLNGHVPMGEGELFATAEMFFESSKGGGIENSAISRVGSFTDTTIRAGYREDAWSLTAYVENLTNELYYDQGNNNDAVIPAHFFGPSRPRTFGVRFSRSFGS